MQDTPSREFHLRGVTRSCLPEQKIKTVHVTHSCPDGGGGGGGESPSVHSRARKLFVCASSFGRDPRSASS